MVFADGRIFEKIVQRCPRISLNFRGFGNSDIFLCVLCLRDWPAFVRSLTHYNVIHSLARYNAHPFGSLQCHSFIGPFVQARAGMTTSILEIDLRVSGFPVAPLLAFAPPTMLGAGGHPVAPSVHNVGFPTMLAFQWQQCWHSVGVPTMLASSMLATMLGAGGQPVGSQCWTVHTATTGFEQRQTRGSSEKRVAI